MMQVGPQPDLAPLFSQLAGHRSAAGQLEMLSVRSGFNTTELFLALRGPRGEVVPHAAAAVALAGELPGLQVGLDLCKEQPCQRPEPYTNDIYITFPTMRQDCLLIYNLTNQSGGSYYFLAMKLISHCQRTAVISVQVNQVLKK